MVQRIRHTGIVVSEMSEALRFYRDLLGIDTVVFDSVVESEFLNRITAVDDVQIHVVMLETEDGSRVELLQYLSHPSDAPPEVKSFHIGCSHIAFQVENIDELFGKMQRCGVPFNSPPQIDPNRYAKVTYCHDFDGTIVELVQILDPSQTLYKE